MMLCQTLKLGVVWEQGRDQVVPVLEFMPSARGAKIKAKLNLAPGQCLSAIAPAVTTKDETNAVSPNEIIHGSPPGPLISNTQVKKLGFAANLNECKEKCRSFMYQVPCESG
jgi:hypothetical protein